MVPTPTIIPGSGVQLTTSQDAEKVTYLMTPRHSMTVTNTKGLLNMPGQNNCFLNSAVQVLWHLDIFRRSFRELLSHACMGESCIFCALKELFTQFQYSQESALPPDALRHALAKTFCDQRRFQLGFMDDAAECFENILLRIHVHIANQEHEDMCGDARCIPHQKFAMTLVEQPMCHNCGTTSEPLPFTQMVHYVTTSALCAKAQENLIHGPEFSSALSFGKLLKQAGDMGEVRDCPGGCGSKIHMKKTLMNHPEIVSIGLVWDSECPSLQHITDVFHSIGMYVRLQDMFHAVLDTEWADSTSHELVGVVTYYGKHYSTFFFHTKLRVWIYFDDAAVREIGPSWDQVVEKCQKGRFQPLLLLFANPNGTSLSPSVFYHEKSATLKPGATIKNSPKIATQRQAVINRYLAFQKSIQNGNSVTTGAMNQSDLGYLNNQNFLNSESSSKSPLPKPSNLYQMRNQVLPTMRCKQCGHLNSQSSYNRCKCSSDKSHSFANSQSIVNESNINQSQPIYSNSQMFRNSVANALPPFLHDSKDISKANEAALPPIVTPKLSARNSVQPFVPMNTNVELQQVANTSKSQEYLTKIENKDLIDHSKDSDSAYAEDDLEINDTYISRKAVENVLNMQKLRQISLSRPYSHGAIGNRNSSSSLESFDNIHSNKSCNTQKESHVLDAENVRIRRDSGNWSSDRNSSSSLSNSSVDNSFLAVVASKRLLLGLNNCHVPSGKSQLPDFSNASNSDHGYDSYSVSSSDSYPSVTGSPVKLDPRLTLIPEDWQGQDNLSDLDKKLLMITEDSSGPPDCDKLCAEADLLLAKSHDKEKEGDLIMAALLSDSAAARARTAMDAPYNNSRSLVSAKMKHSTCVMRSSCLYRRIKDNEAEERRKQKGMTGQHSRQSSRDSTHGRHSRQGSKDGTATKQTKKENGNHVVDENDSLGRNIEIYGTLPKKGSRRKLMSPTGSSRAKDEQVYEDFLDKQRKNINAACVSNDHSPKSSKLPGKLEISKSKIEISEKQSKKSVSEIAAPKSPLRKARDVIMDGNNEDFKGTAHVKKHNSKSCNPEHSSSRSSFNKETDLSNDDEITSKDLLSPIGSTDKKQHKIKRKLMGGFMKRKNRSLPDLREDQDLSDALDRSFDDSSIQMSPTLTLPNGKLKKLEYQPDPTINGVTRGFHQPHYAFVKKDLSHRPLLMKVNPPNIQSTPSLNNMKNKPIHTLPSLPKKIPEPKSKANLDLQIECKSSTPSYFSTSEIGLPAFSLQLPLKHTEILTSSDTHLQKNSEIPSLISQSNCITSSSKLNTVEVQMAFPSDSNGSKDELPLPANPFLAELQAKRRQIIGNFDPNKKVNYHQDTEEKPKKTLLPCLKEISSKQSGLTSNNEGTSWLQELQNKQQQMLMQNKQQQKLMQNKQQQTLVIALPKAEQNECQDVSKIATKLLDSTSDSKFADNKEMKKPEVEKGKGSMKPQSLKNSEKITDGTKDNHCGNTVSSVRNLASRFEKIIKNPTAFNVSTSVAAPGTAANSTDNLNKHSYRPVFSPSTITNNDYKRTETIFQEGTQDDNSEERKMITLEKNVTEAPLCSQNPSLASEQDDLNSKVSNGKGTQQSAVKSEMDVTVGAEDLCDTKGFIPQHRPQAPPDYETALQRLELIRTAPLGEVSQQPDNEMTLPPILSSPTVSSAIAERKRQGPKKTVTFSDKVVLVACADFEEDFMPNPLLERVYQQQCESSGTEGLKYDSPLDYRTQSCENVFPYSNYQSQFPENNVKSTSSPTLQGTVSCHLCHSKYVMPPTIYCTDCEFYMSRFQA